MVVSILVTVSSDSTSVIDKHLIDVNECIRNAGIHTELFLGVECTAKEAFHPHPHVPIYTVSFSPLVHIIADSEYFFAAVRMLIRV